eukprot:531452_1
MRVFDASFKGKQKYDDDPWINFYIQTYDSLHFWLFHLYSVGLRSKRSHKNMTIGERKAIEIDSECYDFGFAKMVERIQHKRRETAQFSRYNAVQKYSLRCNTRRNMMSKEKDSERLTFRDSLMLDLHKKVKQKAYIERLNVFLNGEEYDSDAIVDDIDAGALSNIAAETVVVHIKEYIKNTTVAPSSSLSIGLIFYYWPFYKKGRNESYVEMKHATFKQEILNYGAINMWQYNELIVLKAKTYKQSHVAKSIYMKFNPHLHFDVDYGGLTRECLIALILYSDFEAVSAEFASTFGQIRLNESLESIKERNQKFWWLSKTLREIVQYFGTNGSPSGENVKGPFYTRISQVMNVSEFNIRLCSPVSTSATIEVVTRYNDDLHGMVMQLNNNGDYENARYLRSFNLSWISKYKEDDERLFIGGDWKIRIETVKLIHTKENFIQYFNALFVFDCMCNGSDMDHYSDTEIKGEMSPPGGEVSPGGEMTFPDTSRTRRSIQPAQWSIQYDMIRTLIECRLDHRIMRNVPSYVMETFNTFCASK